MKLRLPLLLRRAGLIAVLAGIFWLSHQPSLRLVPPLFPFQDKLLHAGEFVVLGVALFLNRDIFPSRFRWMGIVLTGILWAALDEVHQSYVVGRDCSSGDFLADCVGLLTILMLLRRHASRRENSELYDRKTSPV